MTIDLGGTSVVAPGSIDNGGGFLLRDGTNALVSAMGSFWFGNDFVRLRKEGVRFDSPTWNGISFSASVGEALRVQRKSVDGVATNVGRIVGGDLKYANEFNGVKVAAAFGVTQGRAEEVGSADGTLPDDVRRHGGSLSLMHVASGLFIQGHLTRARITTFNAANDKAADSKTSHLHVQGGVARNWWALGNTVFYGEYGRARNAQTTVGDVAALQLPASYWGIGVVQNIDAAAMELFVGYRQFSAAVDASALGGADVRLKDFELVTAGARIKF